MKERLLFLLFCFFHVFFNVIASDPYDGIPATMLFPLEPETRWAKTKTTPSKSLMTASHAKLSQFKNSRSKTFYAKGDTEYRGQMLHSHFCSSDHKGHLPTCPLFKVMYCLVTRWLALSAAQEPTSFRYILLQSLSCIFLIRSTLSNFSTL